VDEMNENLRKLLMRLPKENLINLMMCSLDVMQGYNGHSRTEAILMALGAEQKDGKWKLPDWQNLLLNTADYM